MMTRFRARLRRLHARLRGYRTFLVFSPVALLGLLDALNTIDLSPLFAALHVPEPSRAAITTGMAVLAILLRVWTTTPPLRRDPAEGCAEGGR